MHPFRDILFFSAGALDRYSVSFPPRWKELPVSNAKSGNYCQPRCDEATTEVGFSDPAQGTLQIIIIPTTKLLISKKFPSMGDVGTISNVINAISPAITKRKRKKFWTKRNSQRKEGFIISMSCSHPSRKLACITLQKLLLHKIMSSWHQYLLLRLSGLQMRRIFDECYHRFM